MEEEKIFDEKGSLLLFREATSEDIDLLLKMISSDKYAFIALMRRVINNDRTLLKMLDVLSGYKVTFPERRKIYKTLEKIFIYQYVKNHDYSHNAYVLISKQYNKRVTQVKSIVETMDRLINSDFTDGGDIDEGKDEEILSEEA